MASMNWVYVHNGKIINLVETDTEPAPPEPNSPYFWAMDQSKRFKIGDIFTPEKQYEYNKEYWDTMNADLDPPQ